MCLVCHDRDPRYLYSIDAWVRQRSYTRWALEALDNSLVSACSPLLPHSSALYLLRRSCQALHLTEWSLVTREHCGGAQLCALRELQHEFRRHLPVCQAHAAADLWDVAELQ